MRRSLHLARVPFMFGLSYPLTTGQTSKKAVELYRSHTKRPRFSTIRPAIVLLIPNMLIFLESEVLGESSPASEFLILGYGKKSNFRGGTPNLSINSERGTVGTIIF